MDHANVSLRAVLLRAHLLGRSLVSSALGRLVPALMFTAGVRTKHAIGSSLEIICFNAAAGLLGQLRYTGIDWTLTALFLLASLIGMGFGLAIVRRVPAQRIRFAFGCTLLVIRLTRVVRKK